MKSVTVSWQLSLPPMKEVGGRGQKVLSAKEQRLSGKGEVGSGEATQSKEDAFPSPGSVWDSHVGTAPPRRLQERHSPEREPSSEPKVGKPDMVGRLYNLALGETDSEVR